MAVMADNQQECKHCQVLPLRVCMEIARQPGPVVIRDLLEHKVMLRAVSEVGWSECMVSVEVVLV